MNDLSPSINETRLGGGAGLAALGLYVRTLAPSVTAASRINLLAAVFFQRER